MEKIERVTFLQNLDGRASWTDGTGRAGHGDAGAIDAIDVGWRHL